MFKLSSPAKFQSLRCYDNYYFADFCRLKTEAQILYDHFYFVYCRQSLRCYDQYYFADFCRLKTEPQMLSHSEFADFSRLKTEPQML